MICNVPFLIAYINAKMTFSKFEFHLCFVLFQNTYTNAEKLLQAADELAHTGECNPEEICSVARRLDSHIASFATRVQQRHRLLNMAVLFYTHEKEVRWALYICQLFT